MTCNENSTWFLLVGPKLEQKQDQSHALAPYKANCLQFFLVSGLGLNLRVGSRGDHHFDATIHPNEKLQV
ncbi:hypothetical protein KR52_07800 [Synechococcus sp. KORDI-52]|nr:hypothetical protein KR52_07800 [Synechococcus sp. KORDI-52]